MLRATILRRHLAETFVQGAKLECDSSKLCYVIVHSLVSPESRITPGS